MKIHFLTFCLAILGSSLFGQIKLENPSFEDQPQEAKVPEKWSGCEKGSSPDILPGFWSVYNEPADGASYIGLITRQEGSWENVGQALSEPLKKGTCYEFYMDLAHSKTYAGYDKPVRVELWGGKKACQKKQLLAASPTITNTKWKKYSFRFTPKRNINYIIIDAQMAEGIFFNYNGNVLLDNISEIKPCLQADLMVIPKDDLRF